jgi:hypothetical protein
MVARSRGIRFFSTQKTPDLDASQVRTMEFCSLSAIDHDNATVIVLSSSEN